MRRVLTTFILLAFAAPALAQPQQYETGDDPDRGGPGLPIGYNIPSAQLEAAARQIPQVQAAMMAFEGRGYVAVSNADTGLSMINGQQLSIVCLYYHREGLFLEDSTKLAVPVIVVTTRRIGASYETSVGGGAMAFDAQTEQIFDAGTVSPSDQSFTIQFVPGGGGGIGRYTIDASTWEMIFDPNSTFNRYVRCTGWGSIGCVASVWRFGGPNAQPLKIAALMAQPEIGMAILGGCIIVAAIGCLGGI